MNRYEALKHAAIAHAGQVDTCGQPYILHPIAVAEVLERSDLTATDFTMRETAIVVALLHDVWEDTDYVDHNGWLTRAQQSALEALTRGPAERYYDYIDRCAQVPYAGIVKLADLWDNLRPERQGCLPPKEAAPLERRYLKARAKIWQALGYDWWPSDD